MSHAYVCRWNLRGFLLTWLFGEKRCGRSDYHIHVTREGQTWVDSGLIINGIREDHRKRQEKES